MSDDEDYMSDKFLLATEENKNSSLVFKQSEKRTMMIMKRKLEAEEKMREQNKSRRVLESENREIGLLSALSTDNKGFEMMMKMGYKPGQGVGKNQSGRSEPIPMNIKTNRLGLGKICEKPIPKKVNPIGKLENMNTEDFRDRMAVKKQQQLMEVDLFTSQKACQQLDIDHNFEEPQEIWYWPIIPKTIEDTEEEEEKLANDEESEDDNAMVEISTTEKLNILTDYLRTKYFYCIWCGATYDNENDLKENCPGNTRNDH